VKLKIVQQAKGDDMVYTRILSVDNNLSMDDKSDMKKNPFLASAKLVAILGVVVFMMSGCVGNMPSTIEVAATLGKKAYNKCSTLDNWQCLWYD
jgi:hypothetical protein